jgi:hypothetical protein
MWHLITALLSLNHLCPTMGHARVTSLGHREREARPLILAPVYANISHGWSAALAALTVGRSAGPVRRPPAGDQHRHRSCPAVRERDGRSTMPSSTSYERGATEGWP